MNETNETTHIAGPKISIDHIESLISTEIYFTAADGLTGEYHITAARDEPTVNDPIELEDLTFLERHTICVMVLRNGYTVTGESACVDPASFDAETGRRIARQNALAKIWPLEGYLLKQFKYEHDL